MEPERKIEKLLRAFAKKRRADAGDSFKLHPATRRILQGELARRAPKSEAGEEGFFLKLFGRLRPGLVYVACSAVLVFMLASLMMPAFSRAKSKSQMAKSMSNLKQLGVAAQTFAKENDERLPVSLAEIQNTAGSNTLIDPASGKPFVYVAGGRSMDSLRPDSVLAYSPEAARNRAVLYADGRVEAVNGARFSELTNRGLIQLALADEIRRGQPAAAPAAAPLLAANEAPMPKDAEPMKSAVNRDESKVSDFAASVTGAGEKQKLEVASVDQKKLDAPPAAPTAGGIAGSTRGSGQISTMQNAVSPPATPADRAFKADGFAPAQNQSFDKLTTATASGQAANTASQQFTQTTPVSKLQNIFKNASASAQAAPVLANFQVQQNGGEISVVDGDGSIYNGYWQAGDAPIQNAPAPASKTVSATAAPPAASAARQMPAAKNADQAVQNYFFRVAGTNRSLKQNVVFTGNFVAISNVAQVTQQRGGGGFGGGGGAGGQLQQTLTNQSQQWLFSNSRIAGTAVINNTNAIEIDAVPVPQ